MIEVRLTYQEALIATQVGVRRQLEALAKNLPDRHGGEQEDGWGIHVEGAAGELAVAKVLGIYWDAPVNTYRTGGDVGSFQVRTRSEHWHDLLVRPGDVASDAVYILVTGRIPAFRVHGWIRASAAARPDWLKRHGGRPAAYFVPQQALRPLDELMGSRGAAV